MPFTEARGDPDDVVPRGEGDETVAFSVGRSAGVTARAAELAGRADGARLAACPPGA